MSIFRLSKSTIFGAGFIAVLLMSFVVGNTHAYAQSSFNYTDHLMDDSVFRASNTMTAASIQTFLVNEGSGLASFSDIEDCGSTSGSHYAYYATYYTCGTTQKASKIIYDTAQAYGINPEVILATLQKEQSLITTPNPTASQLNCAMGYYSCGGFVGFFNQVDNGTWQFRTYYELGSGNNWWGYSPSSYPCANGGAPIVGNGANVDQGAHYYSVGLYPGNDVTFYDYNGYGYTHFVMPNISTAGMYCYTPHVYPGSAQNYFSGSKNFVYYFNLWFVPYFWQLSSQYAFADSTKTTPVNLNNLLPGQRVYVGFTAINDGYSTWTNSGSNPVDVGTLRPTDRYSSFMDATWLGPNRPARMKEASVAPGQTATFEFWITAPTTYQNNYREFYGLLSEGIAWMPDIGLNFNISVQPPNYSWQLLSQYAYTDNTKSIGTGLDNMEPGQRKYVGLTIKNTGNVTWSNTGPNPMDLGTTHSLDRASAFYDPTWLGYARPARMKEASVAPGQTATFEFWISAPLHSYGSFREYFDPLIEGKAWLQDIGFNYASSVVSPSYSWKLTSQYAYTDSSKTTATGLTNLTPGQTAYVGFTAVNTGNVTWYNSGITPTDIGTSNPYDRISALCAGGSGWLGCNRPARMKEASVAPGQTATFEFAITAPSTPGTYREYFNPVVENMAWMQNIGFNYLIVVK